MEWLLIFALAAWVLVIQIRLASAESELRDLRRSRQPEAARAAARPPPRAPAERTAPAEPVSPAAPVARTPQETKPPPPPRRSEIRPEARTAGRSLSAWLSENGLAWLGGGALALGGALLVAYAAERGVFTPALRIGAALALGCAMLGWGEVIRRRGLSTGSGAALVAATVCGAGATTLYAAIWAAYALYHFLPVPAAAALLAGVSIGLLALALVHGEALGLLAILGAFATPVVCSLPSWNGVALDGYLMMITLTGLGSTSLRGWSRAGLLTLGLIGGWILARLAMGDPVGGIGLMVASPAVAILAVKQRADSGAAPRPTTGLQAALPIVGIVGACALLVLLAIYEPARSSLALEAMAIGALTGLAAAAARLGLARPRLIGAPALGLILLIGAHAPHTLYVTWTQSPFWWLAPIAALALSGLALALTDRARPEGPIIGAAGAALALTLARSALAAAGPAVAALDALPFLLAALSFLAGAGLIARRSSDKTADVALAAWLGAGAETAAMAIHTGLAGLPEPAAYGALGLALALAARRLAWRGLPQAAALACLLSLLSILGPQVGIAALSGRLAWAGLLAAAGAGVALQAAVWRTIRGRDDAAFSSAEAAYSCAVMSALLTAFLILRLFATPHGAAKAPLDLFSEAALRTLLLLMAGLALSVRGGAGRLSRARGPVLLGVGVLHGLVMNVLILNPWWGWTGWSSDSHPPVGGPPVLDSLALAYMAPTLLLGVAAWRASRTWPRIALFYGLAGTTFFGVWEMMEIRRLFHGPALDRGAWGYSEVAAYGVALLAPAWTAILARRALARRGAAPDPTPIEALRWGGLTGSTVLFCIVSAPWWGPLIGPFAAPALYFCLLSAGVVLTALLVAKHPEEAETVFGRAVRGAVILQVFTLLTLLIRFGFHGGAMRTPLKEASAETWTYSAAWAVYGLMVLVAGARSGDRAIRWLGLAVLLATTLKVFLFDMATLEGVIRAASFLALGALLSIGALAARRAGSAARPANPGRPSDSPVAEVDTGP